MKFLMLILPLILNFFVTSIWAQNKTLKLGFSDVESFPYIIGFSEQIANPPGVALDIITSAASQLGISVEYLRLPNKRVLEDLKHGKIDGAFIYSHKPDRAEFAKYPMKDKKLDTDRRIATLSYYLYTMPSSKVTWDGKKFNNLTRPIGANTGYSIV
ncbi:MAG: hypothetical protein HQK53_16720 [Oligoflexia bacterium]|nr:hypothetical protein [Oligoflexia bacterium]